MPYTVSDQVSYNHRFIGNIHVTTATWSIATAIAIAEVPSDKQALLLGYFVSSANGSGASVRFISGASTFISQAINVPSSGTICSYSEKGIAITEAGQNLRITGTTGSGNITMMWCLV